MNSEIVIAADCRGTHPPTSMGDTSSFDIAPLGGNIPRMIGVDREALRALVAANPKSAKALSLEAKLGETAIKDILSGKSKKPQMDTITAIAGVLAVPVSAFVKDVEGLEPRPASAAGEIMLPVRYRAGAGEWQPVEDFDQTEPVMKPVRDLKGYEGIPQWLELVVGNSMNRELPPGSHVHVIDAIHIMYEPRHGDLVIAERSKAQGAFIERSVKQVEIHANGMVQLWPRSFDPMYQSPLILSQGLTMADDDASVRIVGKVAGAYIGFND